jgi:hypothetical protein
MKKTMVNFYSSDTTEGLDNMIGSFLNREQVEVINVSLSSCYDYEKKYVVYSAAIAFSWED